MNTSYPFPLPDDAVKALQSDEEVRPLTVWERYGSSGASAGGDPPWILPALECWGVDFKGTVELLANEMERFDTESSALTKMFLQHKGGGIELMVIDKRVHPRLLTLLARLEDLNIDLDSLLAFALNTWKYDPAVIARQEAQSETAKEELQ